MPEKEPETPINKIGALMSHVILAALIPLVGIYLGISSVTKDNEKTHGIVVLAVSAISICFYYILFSI